MKWNGLKLEDLGELRGRFDSVRLMRAEGGANGTLDETLSRAVLLFLGLVDPPKWPVARPDKVWVNWDDAHGGDEARALDWFGWQWRDQCDRVCLYVHKDDGDWCRWLVDHPGTMSWLETVESECGQWLAVICDAETLAEAWEHRRREVSADEFSRRVLRLAYRQKIDMFEDMSWLGTGK